MLNDLEARAEREVREGGPPILVFLGDYVDRGPASARVLDLLISGRPHTYERRYLRGNHEQAMLAFMEEPNNNRGWLIHGGVETLKSYGVAPPSPMHATDQECEAAAAALKAAFPPEHRAFLEGLERYAEYGGYAFVHAGVAPGRKLAKQRDNDIYWIRDRFLKSRRRFSHRVVHGHTPEAEPFADERRVGVDTGAYATGVLTAARLEGPDVTFVSMTDRSR
ncbi:MAG TPA: metallophosphoesterase, partial [Verrucomicrobiae bacterium]|nr:metallophosphoesterase [Verrucomicrobiae bacterium]